MGLILGDVCGRYAGSTTLARLGWRRHREHILGVRPAAIWRTALVHWRYPALLSWSGLVNAAGYTLPLLFMSSYYGAFVAGQYGLVDRVAAVPSALLGQAASQLFVAEASEAARTNPRLLSGLYARRALWLGIPAVIGGTVYALSAPWLFRVVFGPKWVTAGQFARVLAPATAIAFVASPLSQMLIISGRPAMSSLWDIGRLTAVAAAIAIGTTLHLSPTGVLTAYAAASSVAYGIGMAACYWAARHPRCPTGALDSDAKLAASGAPVE
jgi:O-antigen/teichoic acid export membrane protein